VLDADIKGWFDKFYHNWVLDNLPMPLGYVNLLSQWMKTRIVAHEGEKEFKVLSDIF